MNKDELVKLFSDARGYKSHLVVEGRAECYLNSVRCTVTAGDGPDAKPTSSVYETPDHFFAENKEKFDIVLISGTHVCVQVLSDIENALASLNAGGVVVVHGCLPRDKGSASPVADRGGDAFRAVAWYFSKSPYLCYTVDADGGLAVIDTSRPAARAFAFPHRYMCDLSFDEFSKSRRELLETIPPSALGSLVFRAGDTEGASAAAVASLRAPSVQLSSGGASAPAVPEGVTVVPILNCRTGNNILQVYRGFWFAAVHGIPFDNVKIRETREIRESPALFASIMPHVVTDAQIDAMPFASLHCCPSSMPSHAEGRRALFDMELPERGAIAFTGAAFLYPELPWERSLFVKLFDNPTMRMAVAADYADVLCGNTIGYQIRRGDFQVIPGRRRLSEEKIVADIAEIARRHFGMVKVIVTSDDQGFVEKLLRDNAFLRRYVFHCREQSIERQLYLLSMCDYVVANGQYQCTSCWVNDPQLMWESTFGQIAQILGRSYKFAAHRFVPGEGDELKRSREGCGYAYPTKDVPKWR